MFSKLVMRRRSTEMSSEFEVVYREMGFEPAAIWAAQIFIKHTKAPEDPAEAAKP